jgi:post-segregation antitoxin (ccd killing protein)
MKTILVPTRPGTHEQTSVGKDAEEARKIWREESADAIAGYNEYVDEHGAFSDKLRGF